MRDAVRTDRVSYGITTGFGAFANKRISADQVRQLQLNLVRSHACGIGEPLAAPIVRRMLLLKANSLAAGISGVRTELVDALLAMLNNDVLPVIPSRGSVGASGDLAPLAHISLCLIGEGEALQGERRLEGAEVCRAAGLEPIALEAKEGLALINGTQLSLALALDGLFAAEALLDAVDRDRRADGGWARRQLRAVRRTHPRSEPLAAPDRSRASLPLAADGQRDPQRSRELRPRAGPVRGALHAASARRSRRRARARDVKCSVLRSTASPTIR